MKMKVFFLFQSDCFGENDRIIDYIERSYDLMLYHLTSSHNFFLHFRKNFTGSCFLGYNDKIYYLDFKNFLFDFIMKYERDNNINNFYFMGIIINNVYISKDRIKKMIDYYQYYSKKKENVCFPFQCFIVLNNVYYHRFCFNELLCLNLNQYFICNFHSNRSFYF